jgi:hypothetical protein
MLFYITGLAMTSFMMYKSEKNKRKARAVFTETVATIERWERKNKAERAVLLQRFEALEDQLQERANQSVLSELGSICGTLVRLFQSMAFLLGSTIHALYSGGGAEAIDAIGNESPFECAAAWLRNIILVFELLEKCSGVLPFLSFASTIAP